MREFEEIGAENFEEGVELGNDFFEDRFKVRGLTEEQQERLVERQLEIFRDKTHNTYHDDLITQMKNKGAEERKAVMDTFERYLTGFANVAVGMAYDTFTHNIIGLNNVLFARAAVSTLRIPRSAVKVMWKLREGAQHSDECRVMAQGEDGSGVWDARYLAETGLYPASSMLDCGGNCKCHLTPVGIMSDTAEEFLDTLSRVGYQNNSLSLKPNATSEVISALLKSKFGTSDDVTGQIIAFTPFLRKEFWENLNFFDVAVKQGPDFTIKGQTNFTGTGRNIKATGIDVYIQLPPGRTLDKLSPVERQAFRDVIAHELGHTVAYTDGRSFGSNFLPPSLAKELMQTALKEQVFAISQVEDNFARYLASIPSSQAANPTIAAEIAIVKDFLKDSDKFLLRLYTAAQEGKQFGGRPAEESVRIFNKAINQFSAETRLIKGYQMFHPDEYFAEWFNYLLTHPDQAAFYSPALNKLMATQDLFDTTIKHAQTLLPNAIAVTLRNDLPLGASYDPIIGNMDSFKDIGLRFATNTSKLSQNTLDGQLNNIFKRSPGLLRKEFFDTLDVSFVDRIQMGTQTGLRSNLGFFDKGKFYVNADIWKGLSVSQRSSTIADIISRNLWNNSSVLRRQVRDAYSAYLVVFLKELSSKMDMQHLGVRNIKELLSFVNDEPRNLGVWTRNFDTVYKPLIKNVTDMPIIDIDSLRSPEDFLRSWMRVYSVRPEHAVYYNRSMLSIVKEFLKVV
jgi:hypothetical protein